MNTKNISIADRLKIARTNAGFSSARGFALQYAIPYITYSQHESGKRELRPDVIVKYSELLNVSPSWLLLGKEDEGESIGRKLQQKSDNKHLIVSETNRTNPTINSLVFFEILSEVDQLTKKLSITPTEKDKIKLCIDIYNSIIIYDFELILKNKILKSLVSLIVNATKIDTNISNHRYHRGGYEKQKKS